MIELQKETQIWGEQGLYTLQRAYELIVEGERPWTALGNFMNDFFGYFPEKRQELLDAPIVHPTEEHPTEEQIRWMVFIAASAEYLAKKYNLQVPEWCMEERYAQVEEEWIMAAKTPTPSEKAKERYRQSAPEEFARRNIYCSNRVYASKQEEAERIRALLKSA